MIRAVVLLAVVLAGCAIDPPQGFVALPVGGELQLLAVAPSGSRMRVREVANAEGGSLSFWGAAIQRELVQGRGYALLESVPVTTASGLAGTELRFTSERDLSRWEYLVAVFVDGRRLVVADAGGEPAAFAVELPAVRASLRELR